MRIEDPEVLFERGDTITERLRSTRASALEAPSPQWVEDRFWVWIHYGIDKVRRGELFECMDLLALLRAQALAPLLHRPPGRWTLAGSAAARSLAPGSGAGASLCAP
ncbi:hypothetical protein [Stigmatella erecta]|uniref:Uncharacterized protein n=1 Tax=Stigmatella erecta TaxID=83460 RepID=A0A1I0CQH1_9BACT|nr:hypothetical protein [Stigmatella erecta]SET21476.1 hypothetical protein SAMN05443639_102201 [Stigmatella erecta]